jgi:hypothetical protein
MLSITLWAYWIAYKIATQHSPSELMYGLLLLLPTNFLVLPNQITTKRNENLENA